MVSSRSCILITVLTFASLASARAQTNPPQPPPAAPPAASSPAGPRRIHYGVRFGPSFTTLTSVETFDATASAAAFEPTMNFGGFAHIELPGPLSFQPELLFASKGHRIRDKDAPPQTTPTGELKLPAADRVILVRYLELPFLLRVSKRTHENTSLYLIAGPAIAFRRNAVIREVRDAGRREDIAAQVNGGDMSYIAGGGLQHKRWLVDARITRGIRNIASDPFPAVVKTGAFAVLMGTRF
jgi:Outer membrane protein beta-barrel domain